MVHLNCVEFVFEMTNSKPKEGAYISELIERDVSSMPPNFHLSISKLISDHFEMATAQAGSQISLKNSNLMQVDLKII